MTSRERLLTAMSGGIPDRVPRDIAWGMTPMAYETFKANTGETDYMAYFKVDYRHVGMAPSKRKFDFTHYYEGRGLDLSKLRINDQGVGYMSSEQTSWHYTHLFSPLAGRHDLNSIVDFPIHDLSEPHRYAHLGQATEELHARGLGVAAPLATTLYETAWQLRGLDEFLTDMYENPEIIDCLLERLTLLRIRAAELHVGSGADVLMLGDDVATQKGMLMSPALWRRFFKPRMARIIDAAKAVRPGIHVFYHSDGDPTEIIPELLEIGVNVLNPIQPECMDPVAIKAKYGTRAALWGGIGIQHTLPFGSAEDVRAEVRERMATLGKGGGYICGPTHVIAPEVPWANMKALYDAIDEYGAY
ncbi:MAG: hypothetical protein FWE70_01000 [Oscillospiraceae bacterium]|nr:hypothetical protein [Oscillospiraceae bacterium]